MPNALYPLIRAFASKCCWSAPIQVSISPTFYDQIFCLKGFGLAFQSFQFVFVVFRQMKIGFKSSSQFHQNFTSSFCANIFSTKKLQNQTVTREKLHKTLPYKTVVRKMLVELSQGVNFINIKCTNFSYETSFWQLFF